MLVSQKHASVTKVILTEKKKKNTRKGPPVVPVLWSPVFGPYADSHLKHCGVHHMSYHPHQT